MLQGIYRPGTDLLHPLSIADKGWEGLSPPKHFLMLFQGNRLQGPEHIVLEDGYYLLVHRAISTIQNDMTHRSHLSAKHPRLAGENRAQDLQYLLALIAVGGEVAADAPHSSMLIGRHHLVHACRTFERLWRNREQ